LTIKDKLVEKAYYTNPSKYGDCGALIFNTDGKWVGTHNFGIDNDVRNGFLPVTDNLLSCLRNSKNK